MAAVTMTAGPSLASVLPPQNCQIAGLLAGEAIPAGSLCYIKSDGKIWLSTGAAANAAAKVDGIALQAAAVGESCTIYRHVVVRYGAGLTPGARLYLAVGAGGTIGDAASTGGTAPIGYVVDATRIHIHGSFY